MVGVGQLGAHLLPAVASRLHLARVRDRARRGLSVSGRRCIWLNLASTDLRASRSIKSKTLIDKSERRSRLKQTQALELICEHSNKPNLQIGLATRVDRCYCCILASSSYFGLARLALLAGRQLLQRASPFARLLFAPSAKKFLPPARRTAGEPIHLVLPLFAKLASRISRRKADRVARTQTQLISDSDSARQRPTVAFKFAPVRLRRRPNPITQATKVSGALGHVAPRKSSNPNPSPTQSQSKKQKPAGEQAADFPQ